MWSHGCVDLNDLGTSVLMLPSKGWFPGSVNHDAVIAQVGLLAAVSGGWGPLFRPLFSPLSSVLPNPTHALI